MDTREYLINKFEQEYTVFGYNQYKDFVMLNIDMLVTEHPYLKIGAVIKADIDGEMICCKVEDFYINCYIDEMNIVVDTGYGNVEYDETEEATEEEIQEYLAELE